MSIMQLQDRSAGKSRLLTILADELDYSIRRWLIPDQPDQTSRSPATRSDGTPTKEGPLMARVHKAFIALVSIHQVFDPAGILEGARLAFSVA
jgi:hypothetical protein